MNDFDKSAVLFAAVVVGGWVLAVATEAAAGWLDGFRARWQERRAGGRADGDGMAGKGREANGASQLRDL